MSNALYTQRPKQGDKIMSPYGLATVIRVYDFGTVDISLVASGATFRLTGLPWL